MSYRKSLFMSFAVLAGLVCGAISGMGSAWALTIKSTAVTPSGTGLKNTATNSAGSLVSVDTDGDGLPDKLDQCPSQSDDWFLVPAVWVGQDANKNEDAYYSVRETLDGESANEISDAMKSYSALHYESVDDLAEELSAITLVYLLDGGGDYVYDEITDVNSELRAANKKRAGNYGATFTYDPSNTYQDTLEEIINYFDDGGEAPVEGRDEFTISTETNFSGVIQKECPIEDPSEEEPSQESSCEEKYDACMADAGGDSDDIESDAQEFICQYIYEQCKDLVN